ncbi:MAG: tetratricopeptide repeat protein [Phycisphaerae bacterium]|nr:tetratricopeptide repeat protein [Phycisphaerae bacterium]
MSPAELVARGNQSLAEGEFEKALDDYRQAEVLMPDSPELAYNQGVAYYRMNDLAQARDMFSRTLLTRDQGLEAKAKFNLGNCQYAEALEKMSNLQEAIDELRTAIEYYLDVLEIAPEHTDARVNIETAQLLIKDLLDKLKKEQEQQQQEPTSQPSQCQQKKDQDGEQEQQDGEEKQQQEGQQQGEQDKEQEGEQEQQSGEDQQQDEEGEQQAGEKEEEERRLTKEEAQRLLQAVRDKEQNRRDEQAQRRRMGRAKVTRDW